MSKSIEESTGDLSSDLAALRRDVAQLAASVGTLVGHQTQAAGARVAGALDEAGASASQMAARAQSVGSDIEACVSRNPMTAAMVAFGIGLTLGVVTRTRS